MEYEKGDLELASKWEEEGHSFLYVSFFYFLGAFAGYVVYLLQG